MSEGVTWGLVLTDTKEAGDATTADAGADAGATT